MILSIKTGAKTEMVDITSQVQGAVEKSGVEEGLCMLYVPHTTAAVTINEGADPGVGSDIMTILNRIVPREAEYRHLEGNSPAHIKSTLIGASEIIGIEKGALVMGTWQAIFFCEFDGPRSRKLHVRFVSEK